MSDADDTFLYLSTSVLHKIHPHLNKSLSDKVEASLDTAKLILTQTSSPQFYASKTRAEIIKWNHHKYTIKRGIAPIPHEIILKILKYLRAGNLDRRGLSTNVLPFVRVDFQLVCRAFYHADSERLTLYLDYDYDSGLSGLLLDHLTIGRHRNICKIRAWSVFSNDQMVMILRRLTPHLHFTSLVSFEYGWNTYNTHTLSLLLEKCPNLSVLHLVSFDLGEGNTLSESAVKTMSRLKVITINGVIPDSILGQLNFSRLTNLKCSGRLNYSLLATKCADTLTHIEMLDHFEISNFQPFLRVCRHLRSIKSDAPFNFESVELLSKLSDIKVLHIGYDSRVDGDQRNPLPLIAACLLKLRSFGIKQDCTAILNWPRFFQEAGYRLTSFTFFSPQKSVLHDLRKHCTNLKTLELLEFYEEDRPREINYSFFKKFMPRFEELIITNENDDEEDDEEEDDQNREESE